MVLLVTGVCDGSCWYCPLSDEKKGKNVVYADEFLIAREEDIIEEAESIGALGTGITGGDPLSTDRTYEYISLLKAHFGEEHHIHLYTQTTDMDKIRRAFQMGLDEIRFHPPVDMWAKIEKTEYPNLLSDLRNYPLDVGIEIPGIPFMKDETVHLVEILGNLVDFININELEFSSTNWKELVRKGLSEKSDVSSGVTGSEEFSIDLLSTELCGSLHYCSASFKDGVQMRNRLMRRAERVARGYDIITEEGTLLKGIILSDDPEDIARILLEEYDLPAEMLSINRERSYVEVYLPILEEMAKELDANCFGIEVYPTADALEVERWPLS